MKHRLFHGRLWLAAAVWATHLVRRGLPSRTRPCTKHSVMTVSAKVDALRFASNSAQQQEYLVGTAWVVPAGLRCCSRELCGAEPAEAAVLIGLKIWPEVGRRGPIARSISLRQRAHGSFAKVFFLFSSSFQFKTM